LKFNQNETIPQSSSSASPRENVTGVGLDLSVPGEAWTLHGLSQHEVEGVHQAEPMAHNVPVCPCDQNRVDLIRAGLTGAYFRDDLWKSSTGCRMKTLVASMLVFNNFFSIFSTPS
jgi:hypothetical protein